MITKEQLLASMRHEVEIIKHLSTKIPEGQMDWRPTDGQRSMRELLQYMAISAWLPAVNLVNDNWDHGPEHNERAQAVTPEGFCDAMDAQMDALEKILDGIEVADALETDRTMPWGTACKQGQGFVDMVLKTLVAYRMQLFLYAKQAGASALDSANCWVGVDRPKPDEG